MVVTKNAALEFGTGSGGRVFESRDFIRTGEAPGRQYCRDPAQPWSHVGDVSLSRQQLFALLAPDDFVPPLQDQDERSG